jgi:uridine phosphorylase
MADGDVRGELLAAGERIFASRGYAAATVDDVIRSSGTSRASFYRYFTGKEQLFEELSRQCFREMRDVIRAVASLGRGRVDRREVVGLLSRYQGLNERYGGVIRAWTELTGPPDSPLHDSGTAAVRALFDETAEVLARSSGGSRTRGVPGGDVAPGDGRLRTRAALLFLLIERSSFYVSSQVSRVDPAQLLPTLATLVQRAYLGAPALSDIPLVEFDSDRSAMIEPASGFAGREQPKDMPAVAVACFFGDVVGRVAAEREARLVTQLSAEHGKHDVWEIEHEGRRLAFFQPGLGAPLSAGFLEEVIAGGCRTVVACGGCGALDGDLALGHVVVVGAALRDEGTSFHYAPPSRTIQADQDVVGRLERFLEGRGVPHTTGTTWTTDAFYRETRSKVARRRDEGCITVEMEASALIAVARFRGIRLGQLLYAGDSLAGDTWDHRGWVKAHDVREQLFWLAADAAVELASGPLGHDGSGLGVGTPAGA